MKVIKNTFGVSITLEPRLSDPALINRSVGSSLVRKEKNPLLEITLDPVEKMLAKPLIDEDIPDEDKYYDLRSMSPRTKSKIRKKVIAFSRVQERLSFLTLTFVNEVSDRKAIKVLGAFLDNAVQRSKDFQYLWVIERQTNNPIFPNNAHFHVITNKYWDLNKWWPYWLDIQAKYGIIPRDKNFKPSSAFDVKTIKAANVKGVVNYVTKYVTKNTGKFACQVWNCSRKISQLYTDFFTDQEFLKNFERLEKADQLGGKIRNYKLEFCEVSLIPLNNITNRFYNRLDKLNQQVWNKESKTPQKDHE